MAYGLKASSCDPLTDHACITLFDYACTYQLAMPTSVLLLHLWSNQTINKMMLMNIYESDMNINIYLSL